MKINAHALKFRQDYTIYVGPSTSLFAGGAVGASNVAGKARLGVAQQHRTTTVSTHAFEPVGVAYPVTLPLAAMQN